MAGEVAAAAAGIEAGDRGGGFGSAMAEAFESLAQWRIAAIDERSEVIDQLDRPIYTRTTTWRDDDGTQHTERWSVSLMSALGILGVLILAQRGVLGRFPMLETILGRNGEGGKTNKPTPPADIPSPAWTTVASAIGGPLGWLLSEGIRSAYK